MPVHNERRHLPYTPQQVFDLVADVERYPEFLPWIAATRIMRRDGNTLWVEMVVGASLLRRNFTAEALLERPTRITICSRDALFEHYQQTWLLAPTEDGGTIVEFRTDFELRSRLLQAVMAGFLDDAATTMVSAFKHRARQMYGANGRTG
jgi:coenzyme Q-binding protein COQ10